MRNLDAQLTSSTPPDFLYIFCIPTLDASCYGPVTAIEYCYRYSPSAGTVQVTFNWTVLILEDTGSNFVINDTYIIQSSHSMDSANCTSSGDEVICCDVTKTDRLYFLINFAFGVTESAQGNTHGATLLGFSDALPQYRVNAVVLSRVGLTLSIGSTIGSSLTAQRGLRMLWFVIGELIYNYVNNPCVVPP